ncbi:helix-turn-helix domain-containing protein [Nitrospirillum sp. BR 11828]|uniref:helix-turn-helix domain-containing protein n=1 Tax=Nitrospirillum sp. BR 11828 TaxID=3104325 RepID=UPI003A10026E
MVYSIQEACKIGGFGRTKAYELMGSKILDARKIGSKTVITAESVHAFVSSLPVANIR